MKLSRLYSNKPDLFDPVEFVQGMNVVMAEIRLPENRSKDTHNLGKTTLGRLLDFGFLAKRDPKFFLFKHSDLFKEFIFFLEIELEDASFVTIRRSVKEATKISFKRHQAGHQDLSGLALTEWDHVNMPFERARELLDGVLDWRAIKPWAYRKGLGYLLRSQDDFRDVFHLRKFAAAHSDWKPFLAHVLGFDAQLIVEHYEKEEQLSKKQAIAQTIKNELGGSIEDISKIEGILLLKQKEAEKKQTLLDAFDFRTQDKDSTKQLVDDIDVKIASLNAERYSYNQTKKKIISSLEEDQILFNPDEAQRLFEEAGVLFKGQIKKDFQQLIDFNRAITDERRGYLQEEREEVEAELKRINAELNFLGKKRSEMLSFLSETDIFGKYKQVSDEMVILRADITSLERQRGFLHRLQELRKEIRALTEERGNLQAQIEANVEKQNSDQDSLFSAIRVFFNEIVEEVIDRKALLSVSPNQLGHLEFKAEILDESGNATSADLGHTYRKLLCIAFDLAVLRAHLDEKYPRFVYHDGVFESLDDRKKENLLAIIRRYAELGLQPIITLIDSDMPVRAGDQPVFSSDEIVITLHDEGEKGRIFKMRAW
ncbi:DUF2326 domain-containing protein [Salmonella enterica subsp. diarizonae]|uniref:DUF2326 domain-containing protein n=2 Tax=Enterobacterales TaxID=91347 RepID=A0A8S7CUM2_ECOLX|nr:DUF2326 domain-containing protein [Salmonella enterica]ECF6079140.1 DUF2326 domain-containing protein [Salmonella enterica subsp. diarizonae]EDQ4426022.1 DUF2326 domain-containing protein [Salmonella enterica subsp. salamae]EEZ6489464.1 DUF2326 domain-containing protein [Escherichia coli O156]EFA4033219.1 DUF2326 domain-containing protein [Escherichia coli O108:H9]EFB2195179.1 DUF2326 domain-containing protein [Escherichia coli]WGI48165.1 DUF2326 domain-containing protein [Salmonella enter